MTTETLTIPLTDGSIKGSDFVSGDEDDTQYVTLTDGGNLSSVNLEKFGKGSPSESGEGPGGDDEFYIDLSGFDDTFDLSVMSMDAGDTVFVSHALSWSNVGNVYTIHYIGSDSQAHILTVDLESTNGSGVAGIVLTCFAEGTMINTGDGEIAVENLEVGDNVWCGDGDCRPIQWLAKRHVGRREMAEHPEFRPIRIRRSALGENVPSADLLVSPQHRILLKDWRAELMFGEFEVLVPAVHLLDDRNIIRDYSKREVTYYHFMFDCHQTVCSNGLETESFFPGDMALEGVSSEGKTELFKLFPNLETSPSTFGQSSHLILKSHEIVAMMGA